MQSARLKTYVGGQSGSLASGDGLYVPKCSPVSHNHNWMLIFAFCKPKILYCTYTKWESIIAHIPNGNQSLHIYQMGINHCTYTKWESIIAHIPNGNQSLHIYQMGINHCTYTKWESIIAHIPNGNQSLHIYQMGINHCTYTKWES